MDEVREAGERAGQAVQRLESLARSWLANEDMVKPFMQIAYAALDAVRQHERLIQRSQPPAAEPNGTE